MFQIGKSGTTTLNSGLGTGTGGNYLCINTSTFEILRGNGSACTASSQRYKENIENLDYGLDEVMRLRAVSFTYKPEMNSGTSTHLGFIAEEVELVIPELVTYNNDGRIQGLDYPTVSAVLTTALQELNLNLESIASSTASSTPQSRSFSDKFYNNVFSKVRTWLASAANGIGDFFANRVRTKELCLSDEGGETCITRAELDALLQAASVNSSATSSELEPEPEPAPLPSDETATSTPLITESEAEPETETPDPQPESNTEVVNEPEPDPEPPVATEPTSEPATSSTSTPQ